MAAPLGRSPKSLFSPTKPSLKLPSTRPQSCKLTSTPIRIVQNSPHDRCDRPSRALLAPTATIPTRALAAPAATTLTRALPDPSATTLTRALPAPAATTTTRVPLKCASRPCAEPVAAARTMPTARRPPSACCTERTLVAVTVTPTCAWAEAAGLMRCARRGTAAQRLCALSALRTCTAALGAAAPPVQGNGAVWQLLLRTPRYKCAGVQRRGCMWPCTSALLRDRCQGVTLRGSGFAHRPSRPFCRHEPRLTK
eukprot:363197-Chlamydomonas_euryale.AAC.15